MNFKSFSEYGYEFQLRFFAQLVNDEQFANEIMDIIEADYFHNQYFRFIMAIIKEYYDSYSVVPDIPTLKINLKSEHNGGFELQTAMDTIDEINNTTLQHGENIQEKALHFCRMQELNKAINQSKKIVTNNPSSSQLEKIPELFDKAALSGQKYDESVDVFDNLNNVLSKNYRNPIPSGIKGFDNITGGGFAKKEVVMGIAPLGVGKSTVMSYMANNMYNEGYNVLQVIFEDKEPDIQRKHFAMWSGVPLSEIDDKPEIVEEKVKNFSGRENHLKIHKFPSSGVSFSKIRNLIKRWNAAGVPIDAVIVDYLECIQKEQQNGEQEWAGEGKLVRRFEGICDELNVLGVTCTQGNRCVSVNENISVKDKGEITIGKVEEGDLIETHNGYKRVLKKFPIEEQPVYKIKTKSGKEIKVSAKHEFPTEYNKLKSISTGLSVGDKLYVKKK